MSLVRVFAKNTIYHIYNRGNHKQQIFYESFDYKYFLNKLIKYSIERNFSILCYCLMPNHWHLCLRQDGDYSPKELFLKSNTSYAMYFNKKYKTVGHLYQGPYKDKLVLTDSYLSYLSFYIHNNPWEAGIPSAKFYDYSSLGDYQRGFSTICDMKPILGQFNGSSDEYIKYFNLFKENKIPRIS